MKPSVPLVDRGLFYFASNTKAEDLIFGAGGMLVVCAYCGKVMGEKEPFEKKAVSHGCCEECYLKELEKLKKSEKKEEDVD